MPAPGYRTYIAPERYAQISHVIGLGGHGEDERRERLFKRVDGLLETLEEPRTLAEAGVAREDFAAALPDLVRAAFADPSVRTNPRIPLVSELEALLRAAAG
jgi:acetaldehyde dehydrogenase/alcohol dehydrogenase